MPNALPVADNQLVRRLHDLHQRAGRSAQRAFLVEGRRAIAGFLAAGQAPLTLLLREGEELPGEWEAWVRPAMEHPASAVLRRVGGRGATRLSQATTASGYLAEFAIPAPPPLAPERGGLVLAGIADPGNCGTLIRSAAAFGVAQVAVVGGVDPWSHKVVQASAGTLPRVALHRFDEEDGLAGLAGGAALCALVAREGVPPGALPRAPRWLVVGSEADGLRPAWLALCGERLTLPMPGAVESLNAAIAGSLACYLLAVPPTG